MRGGLGPSDIGDPEVDAFVDRNVVSFVAWDLLAYVSQHTAEARTAEEFAHLLSRTEADVVAVLSLLVSTGVLVQEPSSGEAAYRLTDDPAVRDTVSRFVAASTRREHRLEFVRRVLARVAAT